MIRRNRGEIFGTSGGTRGQTVQRPVLNSSSMRAAANASQQFGRELTSAKPKIGGRSKTIRR
jgi:hypothetical protein